jgi:predicted nuclease with TOPRIM domain
LTDPVVSDLEAIKTISLVTQNDVKHLNENVQRFISQMENHEDRIRYLEINGAKISQKNATDIKDLSVRVDCLEVSGTKLAQDNTSEIREISRQVDLCQDFIEGQKAANAQTGKIAAIIAGIVSVVGTLVGTAIAIYAWGRP